MISNIKKQISKIQIKNKKWEEKYKELTTKATKNEKDDQL